ncbi:MAG: hypothetical protein R3F59_13150 [Myxococcota bacterium]
MRAAPPNVRTLAPGWLVSRRFDLAFVLGPTLLAGALALAIPAGTPLPAWGWALLVLGVDVAHVWSSLYRTYLDGDELRRRPVLYAATPAVALTGCLGLALAAPGRFWTVLAYLAAFHFVRQAVGIGVLYRARSGRPTRGLAARIDRLALYAVTVGPLWWWHTALPLPFAWFVDGDFLGPLPAWTNGPVAAVAALVVGWHVVNRLRERSPAPGADLWLAGTALVWVGGIVVSRSDAAFTVSNVVAHGVPYFALVWWTASRRWALAGRGALHPAAFRPLAAPLLLGGLVVLAFAEEGLWDALVWHDRPWLFGDWAPSPFATVAVGILAVPQVTHYLLDGFVWKMGPSNPELRGLLGLERQ